MRVCLLLLLSFAAPAWAGTLTDGFAKALKHDPTYQAALAEFEGGSLNSAKAGRAYWPEPGFKVGERSEASGRQVTVQVVQPLVDLDRYATLRGADPLQFKADATLRRREGELVMRYYKAVAEWVAAREGLRLNKAKSEAIDQQVLGARRAIDLGTGTVTDLRDAEVRLAQTLAESLSLKAKLDAAERQYLALTGEITPANGFALSREKRAVALPSLNTLMQSVQTDNPDVIIARQSERLADLDVTRKWGQWVPKLNFIAKKTEVENNKASDYVGISFDFPMSLSNALDVSGARVNLQKASEELRAAEQRASLEIQRLHAMVEAGRIESDIRLDVIAAAELSLQANEKSFKGGVRSGIDVLNSIQQLSQTHQEYVTARLALGENLISLHVLLATPAMDILKQVELVLF